MGGVSGEGSVYKEGGTWRAAVSFTDASGKRRRRKRRASSWRDAIRLRAQMVRDLDAGVTRDTRFDTFADEYLAGRRLTWAATTYRRHESVVRLYLVPALGRRLVADITPRHVRDLMAAHVDRLSPRSVNYVRTVLRAVLAQAERWELVTRNAAALVEPIPLPDRRVVPLTSDEAWAFLDAVAGHEHEALYTLAVMTGMRQGELLGLRWPDVDLADASLRVAHQLQRIGSEWRFVAPKSAAGRRMVALPLPAVSALQAHRVRQVAERAELGRHYVDRDLVFTRPGGLPIHGTTLSKQFVALLAEAGLPRRRFHDLRHTAVSVMLEQGVSLKAIQGIVGHASYALTADVYGHLAEVTVRDAADRMTAARESSVRASGSRSGSRHGLAVVPNGE